MLSPKLILSPIDFSDSSIQALEVAQDLAKRYGSELLLMYVVPVIPKLPEDVSIFSEESYEQQLIKNAKTRLDQLTDKVKQAGVRARNTVGLANDTGMEIIRTAEGEKVDLIVIATHGMTGWRRIAFGSVTEKVVRTAECSVLVLRTTGSTRFETVD
jgi:nucleotide-binding universal stress UspA family protein